MKETMLKLHKKLQKNRLEIFYENQIYKERAYHSRVFNYLVKRLIVLLGAILVFIYVSKGEHLLASLISGLSVLVIYHLISQALKQNKLEMTKKLVHEKVANEEFWRRIRSLEKDSFVNFISELLQELPGFSEVEVANHLESEGIHLLCKFRGDLMAVQCQLLEGQNAVESRDARELSRAMSRRKYKNAIIISTTDFRDDTKAFCKLIKEKRKIRLISKNELIEMAKQAGKYPIDEEVNKAILKKIEHRERAWRDAQTKLFAKPRILPYFLYGTVLVFLATLLNLEIKNLYYICAFVLYSFGITTFIMNTIRKQNQAASGWQNILRD